MPRAPSANEVDRTLDERDQEQHEEAKADRPGIELQDSHEQSANQFEHDFKSLRRSGLLAREQ